MAFATDMPVSRSRYGKPIFDTVTAGRFAGCGFGLRRGAVFAAAGFAGFGGGGNPGDDTAAFSVGASAPFLSVPLTKVIAASNGGAVHRTAPVGLSFRVMVTATA
ncbi:MAG: hypothetical protein JO328_01075 [Hyphomicrobiales bacterium]|nr:hypothetical protein [Hyphomicrobiales bacterium]MBV8827093.1 hypothetical protein [Hyphomicrobiales bacterium]